LKKILNPFLNNERNIAEMPSEGKVELDETDWKILDELQHDARITFKELGFRIGLSAPATAERVRKMEDLGIITGYRVEINRNKVGLPITAWIRLSTPRERSARLSEKLRDVPEIIECSRVAGPDSFIMKVSVSSMEHLEHLIDYFSQYGTSVTSIELSTTVANRFIEEHMTRIPAE
jgi:Lrp/AsnC family transcriptional regulator, leucine-responsive regulatory protein